MTRRLLEYDPLSRIAEYYHFDETTEEVAVEFVQDCEPILNHNKFLQNNGRRNALGDVWREHWAEIPNSVIVKWAIEDGVWFQQLPKLERTQYLEKKLRDPDYAYLKTTEAYL
jgi:hypothetical protein|tara:strand:- start:279 stop:617 length:339 start_codon:yes stop_codon:yes gene_type:complete